MKRSTGILLAGVVVTLSIVGWTTRRWRDAAPAAASAAPTRANETATAAPLAPVNKPPASLVEDIAARLCAAALEYDHPVERRAFLESTMGGVPRALYGKLIEHLSVAAPGSVESEVIRAIVMRWAWQEWKNVATWALDHPGNPYRPDALAVASQRWAQTDPAGLLQWAATLPTAADRQWVLLRSGEFLGRTDPALFAVWQQALAPGRERDQLELAITREWAQRNPDELATALAANTGPEFAEWRRLTLAGLSNQLATMDGPAAARFVAEKLPPGAAQQRAALGAVVAWARQDPVATKEWIGTFPSEELRGEASQVLLGYWLETDRAAAEAYAASLPAGPVGDQANERVAQYLLTTRATDALAWAERISDPARKSAALSFVIAEWRRQDPGAVRSLLLRRPELVVAVTPTR